MFTGIIEATAPILDQRQSGLTIEHPGIFDDVKIGSSISVSGVCLSIVKLTGDSMEFDFVPETLAKTKIGSLKKGDRVNLERAMKAGDRLDGHVVQGHVEGVGIMENDGGILVVQLPKDLLQFVVQKGSIAIDGVSLTVADVKGDEVTIALIPHTLKNTTLGSLKKGDRVNIETDMMVRAARKNG